MLPSTEVPARDDETRPGRGPAPPETLSDEAIVDRVRAGDLAGFELIMRRYNQRIFRVVRSILGNEDEAEDVVQDAYVRAYEHLAQFEGRAKFATWLTKIAVHEASLRRRRSRRLRVVDLHGPETQRMSPISESRDAESEASRGELGDLLRQAIETLPAELRLVFTLRLVEGLSTDEAAECLSLSPANVKVRLHRARSLLRDRIDQRIGAEVRQLYQFAGERCDRIVQGVLTRLSQARPEAP